MTVQQIPYIFYAVYELLFGNQTEGIDHKNHDQEQALTTHFITANQIAEKDMKATGIATSN